MEALNQPIAIICRCLLLSLRLRSGRGEDSGPAPCFSISSPNFWAEWSELSLKVGSLTLFSHSLPSDTGATSSMVAMVVVFGLSLDPRARRTRTSGEASRAHRRQNVPGPQQDGISKGQDLLSVLRPVVPLPACRLCGEWRRPAARCIKVQIPIAATIELAMSRPRNSRNGEKDKTPSPRGEEKMIPRVKEKKIPPC